MIERYDTNVRLSRCHGEQRQEQVVVAENMDEGPEGLRCN
jgi:hypothetical protein